MRKKKNIVLESLLVEDYAAEGKALARKEGKVIFIEGVVPGDVVDVRLGRSKKDWAEGHTLRFHEYSKERVAPFCQHFGVCGGCQWQMLPYEKQLQFKHRQVEEVLKRIGKVQLPALLPIAGAGETRFYRNKLEYTFSTKEFTPKPPTKETANAQGSGEPNGVTYKSDGFVPQPSLTAEEVPGALGFHAKGFFDKVVHIEKCWLQPEPTNEIRNAVRAYAFEKGLSFYDIRTHEGFLRTMQVRICTTGEVMVNLVVGENNKKKLLPLLDFMAARFPQITTLLYTINLK